MFGNSNFRKILAKKAYIKSLMAIYEILALAFKEGDRLIKIKNLEPSSFKIEGGVRS